MYLNFIIYGFLLLVITKLTDQLFPAVIFS